MSQYQKLKQRVYRCNLELPEHELVLYTFGNVSAIDRQAGVFVIKPSGVPYQELTPGDMVVVDLDGNVIEGELTPSSDTSTHAVLYRNFPEIGGIAHTHSTYAVAWAQAVRSIPILGTTHADHLQTEIPCTGIMSDAAIRGDYEEETGKQIVETFSKYSYQETPMVIVARHGPFTWGDTPEDAVYHSVILEELARMALLTIQVDPDTTGLKPTLIEKHYQRKHGKDSYYGQES